MSLDDAFRLEKREFSVANIPIGPEHEGNVHMTSLKWDPFGRIHLCTNTPKLFQINPTPRENVRRDDQGERKPVEPKVEQELVLESIPMTTLLTQRHMIVSQADGIISWYKIDMPMYEESQDVHITLINEIEKEYPFMDYLGDSGAPAQYMYYSKSFERIVIGSTNGVLALLPIVAEKMDTGEENEDEENQEKSKQVLPDQTNLLGRFHVDKISCIRELGKSTQFITISQDGTFAVWEATTGKQLSNRLYISQPTSLDTSKDGKAVFIGSCRGIFRAYDVSDRKNPRLIKQIKFYNDGEQITGINCSADGSVIVVTSNESNRVWFLTQKSKEGFEVLGYSIANGHVISCALTIQNKETYALCVLNNGIAQV